jgi:hypothetical protein
MSVLANAHASTVLIAAAFAFSLTLTTTPSFLPVVFLLVTLRLYVKVLVVQAHIFRTTILWISLIVGISFTNLLPSMHALSTPIISILSLLSISAVSSGIALALISLEDQVSSRLQSSWSHSTVFPAIWATVWSGVSYLSPLGRLGTWSPVYGSDSYSWITRLTGSIGTDWIVAAWAVVGANLLDDWILSDAEVEEQLIPHPPPAEARNSDHLRRSTRFHNTLVLGAFLLALTLPSFVLIELPLPPFSSDATPLIVGCVLPAGHEQQFTPTLDDYIAESKKMTRAKVLLWPEGAIKFNSQLEKEEALDRVRQEVRGPYIGVSFEDFVPVDNHGGNGRSGMRRTGISIVSNDSDATLLTYYKRKLVPSKLFLSFITRII